MWSMRPRVDRKAAGAIADDSLPAFGLMQLSAFGQYAHARVEAKRAQP